MVETSRQKEAWPRPIVVPRPLATAGVSQPVVSLGGVWGISIDPPADFWSDSVDSSSWPHLRVPGHTVPQGIVVPRDRQYAYKRGLAVPADFEGKRILLKFEGVTGLAQVWVNGAYLRDHFGGFTTWECDITDHVRPGEEAWLTVGITDTTEGISTFNNGGILRDVKLMAVPQDYVTRFTVETPLDEHYRDAVLRVRLAMAFHSDAGARIDLTLRDEEGRPVTLEPASVEFTRENPETVIEIPVSSPVKWDAEHPNLYALEARVSAGGETTEALCRNVGFRKVERADTKLLVNGREVKLRGINRKDISPSGARSVPPDLCDLDVRLFRAGNVNFIRTSHYPANEEFLDACDRHGMYVESETSVSFALKGVENDPAFITHFMNQFAEMIERDRSHASVIMWSIANESNWGSNMAKEVEYARTEDPTRPLIFSWANRVPSDASAPYDIYSYHYVSCKGDLAVTAPRPPAFRERGGENGSMPSNLPVLHDEYAHVACYNLDEQRRDPNVRSFWGEGITLFWERAFQTEGALGGAIWAGIDNMSFVPEGVPPVSLYEWGLVDSWRREKPEYWLTKKAYSPVRVDDRPLPNPGSAKPLKLPVKNWFDHTNLDELRIPWRVGQESGTATAPNVEPHAEGMLTLPARNWTDGDVLNLRFYRLDDILVDEYNLPISPPKRAIAPVQGPAPTVEEEQDRIVVSGTDFSLVFSKQTGLIARGTYKGTGIIESGPHVHLGGLELGDWSLRRIAFARETNEAVVSILGSCGPADVSFEVRVDGRGLIVTKYSLDALPETTRELDQSVGGDAGGCWEIGVSFVLTGEVDRLAWQRKGLWSAYPEDHIARTAGVAHRVGNGSAERYGQAPSWPWSEDEKDFPLNGRYDVSGRGTNDFRSMKENIYHADAIVRGTERGVRAESDGSNAVRLEVLDDPASTIDDRDPRVKLTGSWTRADEIGSHRGTVSRSGSAGASAELAFTGTGICWLGTLDPSGGTADVYLDGKLELAGLSLRSYRKQTGEMLFSREGLSEGPHTIRIISTAADSSPVWLDAFKILGGKTRASVRFVINSEWNYPKLGWGNYVRDPIFVKAAYENQVRLRFREGDADGA